MLYKNVQKITIPSGSGAEITIETGKLAKQADGAVVLRQGNTMLLATVVSNKEFREGADFLPLSVDYQEKYAAAGRFPGGFLKREARISNYEILISRIVDRAMRPLFPSDYYAEIQLLVSLISADDDIMPDSLVGLAASAAVCISDIPFAGPISEVRVAKIDGKYVVNPGIKQIKEATLNIIVAGSAKDVNMVEGEMKEVSEEELAEAIKVAHEVIKQQCAGQVELVKLAGREKRVYPEQEQDEELKLAVEKHFASKILEVARSFSPKNERSDALKKMLTEFIETLTEEELEKEHLVKRYFGELKKEVIRNFVLEDKVRLDNRKYDEIREIECEVDYLPAAHGSAVFTRGETQSLTSITLGNKMAEQMVDGALFQRFDRFMLHYNFLPFSTGEVKPQRGPARREIGHGNLAQRALEGIIPDTMVNPYTIRVVSDILESNGSSSMATVCAGSLALMDAGIKIKKPVSGIAMGLIIDDKGRYAILSDILGDEDHLGDMDFKVTGTEDGITACQMDIKVDGLSYEILAEALAQAKAGRLHILEEMKKAITEPRADYKPHVPRIEKLIVDNEFIGAIIGPGGKVIQKIQKETGAILSIEEDETGRGIVEITSTDKESMEKAVAWIKNIATKPEVGTIYNAKVKSIVDFGAFLEYIHGKEGLLHISEYSWERQNTLADVLKVGDMLDVKLVDFDKRSGKSRLSRKVLLPKPEFKKPESDKKE
ncbi:MAG: polyribonucleotide nucleotidyltransferase [Bacteroidetes bacterium]|nr:polyribonucleotide nucleotidyltransferase [Bacteroidota bacterium]MBT5529512.1 polyribonucleotide nucleotidyltransferase [Cytophagia bacterium]MBT3423941.1 polyribonucleotide nucleotidyltransferase [Bacteroidota bacterium]MBT3934934.1 polyribonucleotide nucleotidyltransferase [Bacteroidota bacterium]MBT4339478.1 polyribonucleotide nucleotidyltransferase [Bacteroidota bacterium]